MFSSCVKFQDPTIHIELKKDNKSEFVSVKKDKKKHPIFSFLLPKLSQLKRFSRVKLKYSGILLV